MGAPVKSPDPRPTGGATSGGGARAAFSDAGSGGRRQPRANHDGWVARWIPALAALRTYELRSFGADLTAGLTVAAVAVPQAMAYATIVGLPPQYGLYTAIVMTAIGALFDSSKQLINGPTNAISIAVLSAVVTIPEELRVAAVVQLALMVGLTQLAITFARLGDLTRYVSHSVILGFTVGASLLLVLDQLKHLLGIPAGSGHHGEQHFLLRVWDTLSRVGETTPAALGLGLGTVAAVFVFRALNRVLGPRLRIRLPEMLLAVVGAAVAVWAFDLGKTVKVVGAIPAELPAFQVPELTWARTRDLADSAFAIAVLGLLEAIAMAKYIAARTGERLDMNQQCMSEGLANVGGAFFQCYPGSGSLTRSALNVEAGAATQWSGVISAAAVATTMLLFAPLAAYIPRAALAGVLIVTAMRMIDLESLRWHVKATRADALIVGTTALAAVAISIEFCILVGVLISFVLYVPKAARITMVELVVTGDRLIRQRVDGDPTCGKLRLWSLEGELFFGAAPELETCFDRIRADVGEGTKVVVLRCRELRNADAVCVHVFGEFVRELQQRGLLVIVCGVRPEVRVVFESTGLDEIIGADRLLFERPVVWTGTLEAVRLAYQLLGDDLCEGCPRRHEALDERSSRAGWHYQI